MSNRERGELKDALRNFGVSKPLRIQPQMALQAPVASSGPSAPAHSQKANVEESGSKMDSVQNGQGLEQTVSNMDPVQNVHGEKRTVSEMNSVQNGPSEPRIREGFTAVPHRLLRGESPFQEPIDFMIYMHLFTYSHGFGRDTATMSQGQLERFTHSGRNTVKRALERLVKSGWIRCVGDYEHARMSRKWRVKAMEAPSPSSPSTTRSKTDSVQIGQCSERTETGSKTDPVRGSKMDPFLESIPKESSKNSLSPEIQAYFANLKPAGKRESEWAAFEKLVVEYTMAEITEALEHLRRYGVGQGVGSVPCHSPMAYLCRAMPQVLLAVQVRLALKEKAQKLEESKAFSVAAQRKKEESEEAEWQRMEEAFVRAHPSALEQEVVVAEVCQNLGLPAGGQVAKKLAIGRWWSSRLQDGRTA